MGRDRETRESKSQRLLVAFVDNFAATIEFPGEESPEVAARKALEHASDEDVDALIRAVKEAMDAVCYEALPYLAKLMADRLRQPGKDRRFFRDVCRLLCDVDRRELREVWSIATAVDEIRDKTSALPTEQKPFEYNIFMERGPRLRVLTGGQDAHVPLEAHAELATSVGRDALARNGLVRHVSNGDGGWETGTAGTMEGLATLFRAVGSPG